jgi:hypothetical protein
MVGPWSIEIIVSGTEMASWELCDYRTGKNSRHNLLAMFRQSVFGLLAGYEDVNDAGRLPDVHT